jgi:hypothetical protein
MAEKSPWDQSPVPPALGFQGPLGTQIPKPPDSLYGPSELPYSHQMKPCPFCGEMIQRIAKKCRFCNEFLDDSLRKAQMEKVKGPHDDLTGGDILFCILCSGIACIFGIVYAIQGKKKGLKMVGISILVGIVWSIIQAAIQR